jgi:hypothetical protein
MDSVVKLLPLKMLPLNLQRCTQPVFEGNNLNKHCTPKANTNRELTITDIWILLQLGNNTTETLSCENMIPILFNDFLQIHKLGSIDY